MWPILIGENPPDPNEELKSASKSYLEEQFKRMNEEKIEELKKRIENAEKDINNAYRDWETDRKSVV